MLLEERIKACMTGNVRTKNDAEDEKMAQTIRKICEAVDGLSFEVVVGVLKTVEALSYERCLFKSED